MPYPTRLNPLIDFIVDAVVREIESESSAEYSDVHYVHIVFDFSGGDSSRT